jgi:hypothetical protein
MNERQKWSQLGREIVRMLVSAFTGTMILLALADDPWDGDELFKGPAVGLGAYGGDRGLRKIMKETVDSEEE